MAMLTGVAVSGLAGLEYILDCVTSDKVWGTELIKLVRWFSEKVHQVGWPCWRLYYSFVVNKKFECQLMIFMCQLQ